MTSVLRLPALRARGIDYSRQHLERLEKAGKFPKRIQLGPNSIGWVEEEVIAWLRTRIAERDAAAGKAA